MPVPEALEAVRAVATPDALDAAVWPPGCTVLRTAPDEALVLGSRDREAITLDDPQALLEVELGVCGVWMERAALEDWLEREAEWTAPAQGLAQGAAAGLPVKIWVEGDTALVVTRASLARELEERL